MTCVNGPSSCGQLPSESSIKITPFSCFSMADKIVFLFAPISGRCTPLFIFIVVPSFSTRCSFLTLIFKSSFPSTAIASESCTPSSFVITLSTPEVNTLVGITCLSTSITECFTPTVISMSGSCSLIATSG